MATTTSSSTTTNSWLDVGLLKQYDPAQTAASEKLTATTYDPTKATVNAPTDTVQGQLSGILDPNSVLMQRAGAQGLATANSRGLLNSSMGVQAGQAAMIDKALPIASQDASTYGNFNLTNTAADNTAKQFNAQQTNAMGQFNVGQQNAINMSNTDASNLSKRDYTNSYNSGLSTNAQLDQNTWATKEQVAASRAASSAQIASSQAIAAAQIKGAELAAQATKDAGLIQLIGSAASQVYSNVNAIETDGTGKYSDQIAYSGGYGADGKPIGAPAVYTDPNTGVATPLSERQLAILNARTSGANYVQGLGALGGIPEVNKLFPGPAPGTIGYAAPAPVTTPAPTTTTQPPPTVQTPTVNPYQGNN